MRAPLTLQMARLKLRMLHTELRSPKVCAVFVSSVFGVISVAFPTPFVPDVPHVAGLSFIACFAFPSDSISLAAKHLRRLAANSSKARKTEEWKLPRPPTRGSVADLPVFRAFRAFPVASGHPGRHPGSAEGHRPGPARRQGGGLFAADVGRCFPLSPQRRGAKKLGKWRWEF